MWARNSNLVCMACELPAILQLLYLACGILIPLLTKAWSWAEYSEITCRIILP